MRCSVTRVFLWSTLLAATVSCSANGERHPDRKRVPPHVTGVTIATVVAEAVPDLIDLVGTVKARNSAMVAARIPGVITLLRVREGDRVRKGELLARIEARESAAGASGAQAAVEEARQGLEEAWMRRRLADVTFERYQKLFGEQAVTRQEFDVRQTERDVASKGVARAEARLKQVQEASKAAAAVLAYTRIVAPQAGVITARQADLGATVFPAQPLMTIEEEGSYRLELAAPESLLGKIRQGTSLKVALDGATVSDGRVAEVMPTVDSSSRTFTVKVDLTGVGIRSGRYGRAQVPVGTAMGIAVPRTSIREQGSLTSVWVVDKDNLARMRLVRLGKTRGERVEVLAGLDAGERIVTAGSDRVVDGAHVE